ncbi:MAG: DMT family transporter [Ignavibacteriae bacterium]|nr:MAG: DMT family transporter [Ignavibacteriota bacterium]
MTHGMTRHRAEALMALVTLLWGGTFVIIKLALPHISPSAFVLVRFLLATVIAVAIWPAALRGWDRKLMLRGLALGILFGIGFVLQSIGLQTTSASASAFITGTMVVFVPFVYRLVEGTKVRPIHWLSVGAVTLGLWLFTSPDLSGIRTGDVLTLISAIIWAFYVVYIDLWTTDLHDAPNKQNALVIMQFLVTALLAVGSIELIDGGRIEIEWTWALILGLVYCGIFASVITTWIQTRFQRFTHPVRAAVIFALEPLFAAIIAWIVLDESWSFRQGAGASLLIAAIVLPDLYLSKRTDV